MIYNMRGDTYHAGPVMLSDVYTSAVGSAKDGVAASQRALYDAYNSLKSDSGSNNNGHYCKMSDGTLIQWGIASGLKSGNTVLFPIIFHDNIYRVSITPNYNTGTTIKCTYSVPGGGKYTDGFTLYAWDTQTNAISTQSNLVVDWIAIGCWK